MLKDLVLANRSCRGYDYSRKVTRDELLEMIDITRHAAAGVNMQPLKYYLIYDDEKADLITSMVKFGANLPELGLPFKGTEPPAYIIMCHDKEVNPAVDFFRCDIGICAQTITLAATEMGLAGCMIGNYNKDKVSEALGLDERFSVELIISIGKSIEEVKIVDLEEGQSHKYYRDENGIHCVPKRKLEDIIIND
ncbi:MAG: nitroreductase family protein [Clostridiales bacterium]|nr:nitroreductase family protein [Candidatus Crickella merdequi]